MSELKVSIVVEQAENNYSAYSPEIPGCIATGATLDETRKRMREALEFHLQSMADDGDSLPESDTVDAYVETIRISTRAGAR
jgi:predicted RNase H-like HicB family nuclease